MVLDLAALTHADLTGNGGPCLGCADVMRERDAAGVLGVSRRRALALIEEGVLRRLRRGIVVGACVTERAESDRQLAHKLAIRTLLLTYDDCVATHESAGVLLELPLLNLPSHAIGTRARGAWRGGNSRVRIAPLPAHHLTAVNGDRCTTVARTVIDIARSGSFREAVVVGDAAIREHCSVTTMRDVLDECASWADVGKARVALGFLDRRSESPLESVSRVIIHERKLPPPEPQFVIDAGGPTPYRLDFYWEEQRVVGEADGMMKYHDPEVLRAEKVRQERLERLGLTVVRWTWREMLFETEETMARLSYALFG
jgi:very-short-patch-repair endonuclease